MPSTSPAPIPSTLENKLKLSKYLCRNFDPRWSSSKPWNNIPKDVRDEWFTIADELITIMNTDDPDWTSAYWPL